MPETSIVIRAHNEEKHLGNLLEAIVTQEYQNYEIILVDSGSTDKTLEIARSYPVRIIEIPSQDFTFGYSLNVGCRAARGKYLVFASAHVLPSDKHWLGNLVTSFDDPAVGMVYGRQVGAPQSKFSETRDFARLFGRTVNNLRAPLSYANNANAAVRRSAWERHPFDEYLFGLEDIDFARKITADGLLIRYEPRAAIYHIHEERWPQVFNRYRREAIAAVRIGLMEPPQAGLSWAWLLARLVDDLLASFPRYNRARVEEIVRFRYYQWKGSRVGFAQGKGINFKTEKNALFFPVDGNAVVVSSIGQATLEPLALPELAPGEILVKVDYALVSPEDLELPSGTPGRHFAGTIVRIGANNRLQERHTIGQRVTGVASEGRGAYASYIIAPGDAILPIPDGLDMQAALFTAFDFPAFSDTVLSLEEFEEAWRLHRTSKHLKILLKP
ncbi:MAG: glycosyltransferase [bacterium]|nr:glycosyltransferase [bacterium]